MDRLPEVLDVTKIHDNGIEVDLYEKLNHPSIIEYAKKKFYEEYQYSSDLDVVMLLFDDNVINISQGYETFSKMMVECLDMAYPPEKNIVDKKQSLSSKIQAAELKSAKQVPDKNSPEKEPSI